MHVSDKEFNAQFQNPAENRLNSYLFRLTGVSGICRPYPSHLPHEFCQTSIYSLSKSIKPRADSGLSRDTVFAADVECTKTDIKGSRAVKRKRLAVFRTRSRHPCALIGCSRQPDCPEDSQALPLYYAVLRHSQSALGY